MLEGKSQCPFCFANVGVPALTVREAFGLTGDDEGTSERARRLQQRDNGVFVLDDLLTPEHLPVLVSDVRQTITLARTAMDVALRSIEHAHRTPVPMDMLNTLGTV
jgi:hypothetical protein